MTKYKVVLVPFPFDDLSATKVRPAICLTNPVGSHRHVVIAFISSQIPQELLSTDFSLLNTDEGFSSTGLHVSSVIRLHRLTTVTTRIIRRQLGLLTREHQEAIDLRLRRLFLLQGEQG